MNFTLLGDRAEVEALNKYPTGCIKHLGLIKYIRDVCRRQRSMTLSEVAGWLESYKNADGIGSDELVQRFKLAVEAGGIKITG